MPQLIWLGLEMECHSVWLREVLNKVEESICLLWMKLKWKNKLSTCSKVLQHARLRILNLFIIKILLKRLIHWFLKLLKRVDRQHSSWSLIKKLVLRHCWRKNSRLFTLMSRWKMGKWRLNLIYNLRLGLRIWVSIRRSLRLMI